MNKNKIIKSIIITILTIGIIFAGFFIYNKVKNSKQDKETITPLLYEVTKDGSNNKIYLFGSIHVANSSDFDFPKYIIDAYEKSNYLACEFNVIEYKNDQDKLMEDISNMMYLDGTTLKNHLDIETYEKIVNFLKQKNMYNEQYDNYRPFFIESLITLQTATDANLSANDGIDEYFINKAINDNKTILELESSSYQLNVANSLSDKLYNLIFNDTIDNYDENVNSLKKLYQSWKTGNEKEIISSLNEDLEINSSYTSEEKELIKEYNTKINDERNIEMANKLIEYFDSDKDVFFMVGTAHIVSENGLVNILKENGFNVKQIKEV